MRPFFFFGFELRDCHHDGITVTISLFLFVFATTYESFM